MLIDWYEKILAKWPVPYETLNIATRHGETFVIASGEENLKPLILLHGARANSLPWMGDILKYYRHFRTYAVDIIGEPGKSAETRPIWDGPGYSEWMDDLIDNLNIERVSIVGMSYGGWMALKYVTYRPEKVEKLALIAPAGIIPIKSSYTYRAMLLSFMGNWGAKKLNRILFGNQSVPQEVLNYMDAIAINFKARTGNMTLFTDKELERLTMPTLLLGGLKDPIQDMKRVASRMKKLLPEIEINIHPDKGHVMLNTTADIIPFLTSRQF